LANKRSLNKVILIGNVGRDPEITHIPNLSKDVAKFSLATTEVYKDKAGQFQESTEWHNIVAWGFVAQRVERSVKKGCMVMVEGRLRTRKWQDRDGKDQRSTEIHADTVVVLKDSEASMANRAHGGQPEQGASGYRPRGNGGGQDDLGFPQAPPEVQIDQVDDYAFDEDDPF
jgi:single-strand DNA-binding protein